jgi:hypothetical protein
MAVGAQTMKWVRVLLFIGTTAGLVGGLPPSGFGQSEDLRRFWEEQLQSPDPKRREVAERVVRRYDQAWGVRDTESLFNLVDSSGGVRAKLTINGDGSPDWSILHDPDGRLARALAPRVQIVEKPVIRELEVPVPVVQRVEVPLVTERVIVKERQPEISFQPLFTPQMRAIDPMEDLRRLQEQWDQERRHQETQDELRKIRRKLEWGY